MPTNIDQDGHYPLEGDALDIIGDYITTKTKQFDYIFRDQLSLIPPLDKMDYDQREQLKKFAWKVYEAALVNMDKEISDSVQRTVDMAYEDGKKDAPALVKERIDKVQDAFDELRDQVDDTLDDLQKSIHKLR